MIHQPANDNGAPPPLELTRLERRIVLAVKALNSVPGQRATLWAVARLAQVSEADCRRVVARLFRIGVLHDAEDDS